jgi:hypothetical protein
VSFGIYSLAKTPLPRMRRSGEGIHLSQACNTLHGLVADTPAPSQGAIFA